MTSTSASRSKIPKLCPRCGAFYQDLSSQTCPQCFARLEVLSDDDAIALIAEQEKRASDPEILRLKAADDEQFREQSFGACFGVALILLATVIIAAIFIISAAHRQARYTAADSHSVSVTQPSSGLPADFDTIIPRKLAGSMRSEEDVDQTLPGTNIAIYHATYTSGDQVFALTSMQATSSHTATLTFAASFAAKQHAPPYLQQEVRTAVAQYSVIGPRNDSLHADVAALSGH